MLLLYILIIWQIQALPEYQFNMYNTDNHQNGNCLSYHWSEIIYVLTNPGGEISNIAQIMSYCFRPTEENNSVVIFNFQNSANPAFHFTELRQQNITSQMLLSWSASIDIAEQYQIFLNNYSNSSSEKDIVFYNCTSPWFGPFCQFTFDYQMYKPFTETVFFLFNSQSTVGDSMKITCYIHLSCQTLLSCLDWREICDGKRDCLDGSDEDNCWQLEVNECTKDEYRCHNGLCIPIEFLRDAATTPDCLDQTDEESYGGRVVWNNNPNFECEEHTCRPGKEEFPCGNGQCIEETSKCQNGRNSFLPSTFCSNATACSMKLFHKVGPEWCERFCSKTNCLKDNCSMVYEYRSFPLLFGHVRFMISKKENDSNETTLPDYVCYDIKLCPHFPPPTAQFHNFTCHRIHDLKLFNKDLYYDQETLVNDIKNVFRGCLITTKETHYCNYSTMYQCENSSKCISKHRLLDGIQDCPFNDETFNQSCSLSDTGQRFKCRGEENDKCFDLLIIRNGKKECKYGEDEYNNDVVFVRTHISFQTICDGVPHLLPELIYEGNETDETECEHWPCNNTYSRCDGFWSCKNGSDEVNCPSSTCSEHHHDCVFPNDTTKMSCLSISRVGDGTDDCLGGTDERAKYYEISRKSLREIVSYRFHCKNDTKLLSVDQLCDNNSDCRYGDDEVFCKIFISQKMTMCWYSGKSLTDVENFFCKIAQQMLQPPVVHFKLNNILNYPLQLSTDNISVAPSSHTKTRSIEDNIENNPPSNIPWWCNRGVPIRFRMNDNSSTISCLCPPSYYGDKCQYQNQRVSLTFQVRAASDWRTVFVFLVTLIDNQRNIESHDHIEYLPIRYCRIKFNIYLLYSTRPKNSSKTYSVQIDAFNQVTLKYRASWIFSLSFSFLPVHRLAVLLKLPLLNAISLHEKCSSPCIHGQCFHYVNDPNSTFCRCETGWSGVQCDIEYKCDCAPDSLCISDSICLCPPGGFGRQCHLFQSSCHSNSCVNGGQCAYDDARYTSLSTTGSMCVCPEGYVGERCEHQQIQTRIDISFHYTLTVPSFLLVHFIGVDNVHNSKHNRTSTAKKIQFDQSSLTLYISTWFSIALAQISSQYYLIILREKSIASAHISTKVIPSHRCRFIGEVMNETLANEHLLKRIKFYHMPCREQLELVCFYDDVHICLCTLDRQANCFEFDHNMTYDCDGHNYCGNDGQCFLDHPICPASLACACRQCSFGSRCQLSTKGSALSLDIILGYHIHSKNKINQQPIIVKVAIALITVMFTFGFINSVLSFETFRGKQTRNVGCGYYLFTSSIISMIIVIVLTFKVSFVVASHIGSLTNRSLLYVECALMDFLVRFLLSTSDWLSACVAIERAVNVIQGINFNKEKSKQMAKWMILIISVFCSCSYIYDPLHRQLVDDEEEERTWCVTQYSSSVQIFDWLLNIFHFSLPFAINCISAIIIIIIAARTRSNSQKSKSFKEHLREQLHHHKHLLISPLILIVLSVPRLIISFLSGCMESARDSWFYLIGYFISFLPSIMTFLVYVVPSDVYKKEFSETMKRFRQ